MGARLRTVIILGAMLVGCAPGPGTKPRADTAKIIDSIKSDEVRWNADWRSGDAGKLAAHYAPEAVVMVPGAAPMVGAAAIKAALTEVIGAEGFSMTFSSDRVEAAASGDLATAHGQYRQTTTDAKSGAAIVETGSYVTVYKPGADGVWRAVWDINTPGPPFEKPMPPAP